MNLNTLMGLLLMLLVASCGGTGTSLHFAEVDPEGEGLQEQEKREQEKRINNKDQVLKECGKKVWERLETLASNKGLIIMGLGLVDNVSNDSLWRKIEPYLGKDDTTLLITLTLLGQHNNAYGTLLEIVNKLKQEKAKWLVEKLIEKLYTAARVINDNDKEKFELIKSANKKRRESLHIGVTRIKELADNAGIDTETHDNLLQLRGILGFDKWAEQN